MKKVFYIVLSLLSVTLLLSGCYEFKGTKECSCKYYVDGDLFQEWTGTTLIGYSCSELNTTLTTYIDSQPSISETKCKEMF